jgi:hypothetical protein
MTEPKRRPGRPSTGRDPDVGRSVRVPKRRWDKAAETAAKAGTNRSAGINQFLAWWNGEPDAALPERPEPPASEH